MCFMNLIDDIRHLLDDDTGWTRDKPVLQQVGSDWVQITTPDLDRHNDYLQFYVRKEGTGYLLTDDGDIIEDLLLSGCALDRPECQESLKSILDGYGVQRDGNQLFVRATSENFSRKKHDLAQAMLAVSHNTMNGRVCPCTT
jgi:hypothetical protein